MEWKCFHWEIMWRYSSGTEFKRTLEWSEMDQGPIALLNVRWQRNLGQGIFISQKSYKSRCAAVKTDFNCLWPALFCTGQGLFRRTCMPVWSQCQTEGCHNKSQSVSHWESSHFTLLCRFLVTRWPRIARWLGMNDEDDSSGPLPMHCAHPWSVSLLNW